MTVHDIIALCSAVSTCATTVEQCRAKAAGLQWLASLDADTEDRVCYLVAKWGRYPDRRPVVEQKLRSYL
jgi:hypothetical protein